MTQQSSVLSLFSLLLLMTSLGVSSFSLPLQTIIPSTAFAQNPSSSLADEIIDETLHSQDSSADDNVLVDNNEFGDEDAAIDQNNEADEDAANVGLQDQDSAQEAANTNVDVQEGVLQQQEEEQQPPLPPPPPPPPPPPEEDTTPPTLTVPEDIVVEATSMEGAVVRYTVTAEDNVDGRAILDENNMLIQEDNVGGSITISCDPPSGSTFSIGDTTVECTATDAAGNIGRASFMATVNLIESPRENGKIAFNRFIENSWEIFVMNADGSNQQRLTNNPGLDAKPDWSPDGSKIAFTTDRHGSIGTNEEIYVMNADGSGQRNLSNDPGQDLDPGWSPDGTKIVFYSLRDRQSEIYVMNADGSGQTRLTDNPAGDDNPDWGPATNTEP